MPKKLSVSEIKAVAESAVTARYAADTAKKALEADPENESLQTAYDTAETAATEAKSKADALSQDDGQDDEKKKKVEKIKRKMQYLKNDLKSLGVSADDDTGDLDDLDIEDPDKPLTLRDLQRIEADKSKNAASDMADAIEDSVAREAVKEALKGLIPSGNPETDYRRALAIASQEKNSKMLEELMRKPTPPSHRSGAGSPPRQQQQSDKDTELTAEEKSYMRPPFNLSREAVLAARKANEEQKK